MADQPIPPFESDTLGQVLGDVLGEKVPPPMPKLLLSHPNGLKEGTSGKLYPGKVKGRTAGEAETLRMLRALPFKDAAQKTHDELVAICTMADHLLH